MAMEQLAYSYILLPEWGMKALSYGLICLGGVIALLTRAPSFRMLRGPYFTGIALCTLAISLTQFWWLGGGAMMQAGTLWLLMLGDIVASLAGGYVFATLAQARSLDAYGDAGKAFLAFIPFANLWLLFTPSKHLQPDGPIQPDNGAWAGLVGAPGAVLGIVLMLLNAAAIRSVSSSVEALAASDPRVANGLTRHMAQSDAGLEELLRLSAQQVTVPARVDEITTLNRVDVQGTTISYHYAIASDIAELPANFSDGIFQSNCKNEAIIPILTGGGTLEYVYTNSTGVEVARYRNDQASCETAL